MESGIEIVVLLSHTFGRFGNYPIPFRPLAGVWMSAIACQHRAYMRTYVWWAGAVGANFRAKMIQSCNLFRFFC